MQTPSVPRLENLLGAEHLSPTDIRFLFDTAKAFAPIVAKDETLPLLKGLTVVHLFFEASTRTLVSFDLAARKLGATTVNFSSASSSVKKGETLLDTAKNIQAMRPHCIVVRHECAGSPHILAKHLKLPIINAGDGFHEHPTQGLLDAFTIEEKVGSVAGKTIVIIGDIAHSRVARSNIHVLKKLGAKVTVCSPPSLMPPAPEALGVQTAFRLEEALPEADVVMALRIQLERQNKMQIPTLGEYSRFWGINDERAKLLKKNCIILHPGPINRGVELTPDVADGPQSVILDQVANGILIRMAVLATVCRPKELGEWRKGATP
ncbi:MAG: aspartate carbamoyltransferase catalytic subunit [Bacteriovoracia bacterium]